MHMEATTHDHHHDHHEMPTSGRALDAVALSATLHCLTGCAIGEVTGMVIGTALGFSDLGTIALAVALAFLFGYTLTSLPLLRAGLALSAVIPIAFASDTISIAIMEVVDNAIMVAIPGAMEAGVGDVLFWGALSVALVIAGAFAFPANRWLIARGKGHVAVHNTGIHGGPPVKLVGAIAVIAAIFGTVVLVNEAISGDGEGHGGDHEAMQPKAPAEHGSESAASGAHGGDASPDPVRGLSAASGGVALRLATTRLQPGQPGSLRFSIVAKDGTPVRDYEVEHEKRLHLIVARRDLTGFQHLHPQLGRDGSWSTPLTIEEAGDYRVFADFKRGGVNETLATDLTVDGPSTPHPLAPPSTTASTGDGYTVELEAPASTAGERAELAFTITRGGERVETEPYLGAGGHLVALREGDMAYLHVHPTDGGGEGGHGGDPATGHDRAVRFETEFPSADSYRLFLQFKHGNEVHTAAFTREVE